MRFIVIDMSKNEVRIYNSKAVIYQNDYDVWQFRIWLADEDKYFRQSLRTKDKAKALAEEEKKAVKAHKKEAVATVKKLILEFNLTKGDIRGKAMKQLEA